MEPGAGTLLRFHALACDYDGTLAQHGRVPGRVIAALERVKISGRKLLLVSGRTLPDLAAAFPGLALFDRVVAENGAVVHQPDGGRIDRFAPPADERLVAALRDKSVSPLAVGDCIVATWEPWQDVVLETIRTLGLELQVIFNKGAVMVLPSSINKATGLRAALLDLGLSPRNAVGVGDAENDHAFLSVCECAVAVRNALPALQQRADWVTEADHGAGVVQLIDRLMASDLADLRLDRHRFLLGRGADGDLTLPSWGTSVLVAGTSGSGKSTFATGVIERLAACGSQICVIDPEGDYGALEGATVLGSAERPAGVDEAMQMIEDPTVQLVVNGIGLPLASRPDAFLGLLSRLHELRVRTGRPHWIVIDEAHHVLTRSRSAVPVPANAIFVTVHPDQVAPAVLESVQYFVTIGREPDETLARIAHVLGVAAIATFARLDPGEALLWDGRSEPVRFRSEPARSERRRHVRKYVEGTLPEERSFYFRGEDRRLNLRAANLQTFLELADGVDAETWLHHLAAHDYSEWMAEAIKDAALADEVRAVEDAGGTPEATRAAVRAAVERRYTLST
jgi:hydroxymethylpyrimidine pyrophosphatase-like HAD family hydrolase